MARKTVYVLERISTSNEDTLGILFRSLTTNIWDFLFHRKGKLEFKAFTLEDERRDVKVPGETRIPAGEYEIKLRTEGGMHNRYTEKFNWHQGMLWLQDVQDFEYIYIHIGNTEDHSAGCILVGSGCKGNLRGKGAVTNSTEAYKLIYQEMVAALEAGPVHLWIRDVA